MEKEKEEGKRKKEKKERRNKKYNSGAVYASVQLYKRGRHIIIK
jgi:hypothetical protein